MNLRDLKYFVALAEHRHFGKAAAASFVSQPTLSMQIRKLEEELGVSLFERTSRKVMLTPIGSEMLAHARSVIDEIERMRNLARSSQDPSTGSIRLGAFPTLGPYFLPLAVPALREAFPQLELFLVEEKSDLLVTQLKEGKLDAALLALPLHDDRITSVPLFDERFLLATPGSDPLATARHVRTSDLVDHSLLLLEDGHCMRDQALEVCRMSGARERAGFRATSLETLRQMVAAGMGMTLLPELAVREGQPNPEGIVLRTFEGAQPMRTIGLAWRTTSPATGFLQQVAQVLRDKAAEVLITAPDRKTSVHR